MAYLTNYQYYQNGGVSPTNLNQGSYQYMSIKDIVNNFTLFYTGEDKYLDNVPTHDVRFHAKNVVKRLNYDAFKSIKVIEIEVDSSARAVMPHDYVDFVRISYEKNGILFPMTENTQSTTAKAYLKDVSGDLVFDVDGVVEYDTSILETSRLTPGESTIVNGCSYGYYQIGRYGVDASALNSNPKFSINKELGTIEFGSEMIGELIVLEYVSDGMENGDDDQIVIHKFFEQYVYNYINHMILQIRNAPVVLRQEAKKAASAEYRNSKIRISKINPEELLMTLRGQGNWIK